jgi:pyruvate/2-oxoglutarate/acetoin dehydrogenase E1 component
MELGFDLLDAPVQRVAALDVPIPCGRELEHVYPTAAAVVSAVELLVGEPSR